MITIIPSSIPTHIKFHSPLKFHFLINATCNSRGNRKFSVRRSKSPRNENRRRPFRITNSNHSRKKTGDLPASFSSGKGLSDLKSTRPIHTSSSNTTAINSSIARTGRGAEEGLSVVGGVGRRIMVGRGEERRMLRGL